MSRGIPTLGSGRTLVDRSHLQPGEPDDVLDNPRDVVPDRGRPEPEVKEAAESPTPDPNPISRMLDLATEKAAEVAHDENAQHREIVKSLQPILKLAAEQLPKLKALQVKYADVFASIMSLNQAKLRSYKEVSDRTVSLLIRAARDGQAALSSGIETCASAPRKAKEIIAESDNPRAIVSGRALVAGLKYYVECTLDTPDAVEGALKNIASYAEVLNSQLAKAEVPVKLSRIIHAESYPREIKTPRVEGFEGVIQREK